jgi:hypothetical protein
MKEASDKIGALELHQACQWQSPQASGKARRPLRARVTCVPRSSELRGTTKSKFSCWCPSCVFTFTKGTLGTKVHAKAGVDFIHLH